MVIRLHCEDCNAKIKVPDGAEGKNIKCPRCGAIHRVPSLQTVPADDKPSTTTAPASDTDLDSLASALGAPQHDDEDDDVQETSSDHLADQSQPTDEDDWSQEEDQPSDEYNPLDALAAMAGQEESAHDDEDDLEDQEYDEDLDDPNPSSEQPHIKMDLSLQPHEPDYGVAMAAGADYDPGITPVATRPKPKPNANPIPIAQPADQADARPQSPDIDAAVPTPLSMNRPSPRPQPKAIPLADPAAKKHAAPTSHNSDQPYTHMLVAAWVLRVLAGLSVGGAVKLMLVASSLNWPAGDCLVVLLVGLVVAATVWGLAEIVFAVRDMARRNANR